MAWRLALAAVAACAGVVTVSQSLANAMLVSDPGLAHQLAPNNGAISATLSFKQMEAAEDPADRAAAVQLARQAARQSPTAVAAYTTMGLDAQFAGRVGEARRFISYAERLSRRELAVQLFAISDAVERGQTAEALHHYDIAMRTIPGAQDILSPILAGAAKEASVRTALVKLLTTRPAWAPSFLDFSARAGSDPAAAAALFTELRKTGAPTSRSAETAIIDRLMTAGSFGQASAFYQLTHPGVALGQSRDPRFSKIGSEAASLLDWVATSEPDITIDPAEGGGVEFSLRPGGGGPLVTQDQLLTPGAYVLEGQGRSGDQSPGSAPYWVLSCKNGSELGRVAVASAAAGTAHFKGLISVPQGCPSQTLTLVARPSDLPGGVSGKIDWVTLKPAPAGLQRTSR